MLAALGIWFLVFMVLIMLFVLVSAALGLFMTTVPFMRTPSRLLLKAFQKLPLQDGQIFFDLGSGDGNVIFIAEKVANIKGYGFERTLWTHLLARLKAKVKKSGAEFIRKDFFQAHWGEADVFFAYLLPHLTRRLERQFIEQAKLGALLLVVDFRLPGLKPFEKFEDGSGHVISVYQKT